MIQELGSEDPDKIRDPVFDVQPLLDESVFIIHLLY